MFKIVINELVSIDGERKFLGQRYKCRFCGTSEASAFGKKTNAHTFPEALGNKSLFSLDECSQCNTKFSLYEDALCKAVGPYLTLGGTVGKNGVRQTGRTKGDLVLKHEKVSGNRQIYALVKNQGVPSKAAYRIQGEIINLRIPVSRESFIPLYAYKALLKIALSLMPEDKLQQFQKSLSCLQDANQAPGPYPLQVGFSYAFVGNSPPTLGCAILQLKESNPTFPYSIAIFQAGSVCFQIALHPDDISESALPIGKLGIEWRSILKNSDGSFHQITYSEPSLFDWSAQDAERQPFEAFELKFDTRTCFGEFTPIKSVAD